MHDDVWRRAGFDGLPGGVPPGASDDEVDRADRRAVRRRARRARGAGQQLASGRASRPSATRLAARQRRPARRRRAHRALLHRLGHEAGDGGRAGAGRLPARAARRGRRRWRRTRRSGGRWCVSTQRAAQASLEWFENIGQYVGQAPEQFAFNIVTRSRRITYDNLRLRDPEFVPGWSAGSPARQRAGRRGAAADVPAVPAGASWSWPTGSSSRRWTCTRRSTGCRPTSTSSTSAARRSAAPGW